MSDEPAAAHDPERHLAHHFDSLGTQEHALRLGMWMFLASEILLFGGLFALYAAYRTKYSVDFAQAFEHNNIWIGSGNTVILIVSSFTVAWSLHALRGGRRRLAMVSLGITIFLGTAFLGLKGLEYGMHISEGIMPAFAYHFDKLPQHGAQIFFTLYYMMTGLHAIHMIAGVSLMTWMMWRIHHQRVTAEYHVSFEMSALYWHMVDSIWIFLWPLFYLAG